MLLAQAPKTDPEGLKVPLGPDKSKTLPAPKPPADGGVRPTGPGGSTLTRPEAPLGPVVPAVTQSGPNAETIVYEFPARGDMPALKVFWCEGLKQDATGQASGNLRSAKGDDRNFPQLLLDLRKQYPDEELDSGDSGTLYVGEKGVIFTGTYGDKMHIVPYEKMKDAPQPPKTLPRPKGIFVDFLDAVRAGKKETSVSFDYGTRLTEFALLGNLAQHAGAGKKVMWDGANMKVSNLKELNPLVKRDARKGWRA